MADEALLQVDNLKKYFDDDDSLLDQILDTGTAPVRAVDGVSFSIDAGQTFGLVGESGCGKSTVGQTVIRMLEPTDGVVRFREEDISEYNREELKQFRRNAQIVYQDPFSSLNPRMTVRQTLREPLEIHGIGTNQEKDEKAEQILQRVGLSIDHLNRYPHEFSGGQRQRICIARALITDPDFIVLDEPVSALDVSVQAQILNLLNELQQEMGLTYLFIAHDLGVVRYLCDRVAVMYLGDIVEIGTTDQIFDNPQHPYTEALLESIPRATTSERNRIVDGVEGDVPSPRNPPSGCRFHTRCQKVIQPQDVDIDQAAWRSIVTVSYRLEQDRESFEEYRANEDDDDTDPRVDEHVSALRTAYNLPDSLGDSDADRALSDALTAIVTGDFEDAEAILDDAFPTICKMERPSLVDVGNEGQQSACFLCYDDTPVPSESPSVARTETSPD